MSIYMTKSTQEYFLKHNTEMITAWTQSCALQLLSCNIQPLYTFFKYSLLSLSVSKAIHLQNKTPVSFLDRPHLATDQQPVQSPSAHSGSGKQTVWPSGVSNTVLHPSLAFTYFQFTNVTFNFHHFLNIIAFKSFGSLGLCHAWLSIGQPIQTT